ncbi:quinol:cytochrome c oxidoreductase iron-sulfur protein precursor [Terriglobus roseus]|uniref:Quinol:cytochrome c oxidoreductase iron-sulfur protein n=2 Tax=Terriglobus roseus TaxID=392734 RepID=A0A1H4MG22_9BACT|nr:quinol:cytochrome c oxidoreductase iron-sulfur protein precursor [Terriglobus roseus]
MSTSYTEKNGNGMAESVNFDATAPATASTTVVTTIQSAKLTLADVRKRLDGKNGKRFWQSMNELSDAPGFEDMLHEEFPRQASELTDGVSRRGFMKVMGASLALAATTGCTKQPDEPIFAYVKSPEDLVLGKPNYFATAYPFPTGAVPVLVKSEAYRPIKIDGNPEHPVSKGRSDVFTQATLLDLYDPDRSAHVIKHVGGATLNSDFGAFSDALRSALQMSGGGQGVYVLSEPIVSPSLAAQWKQFVAKYPSAKLVQWSPVNNDSARIASKAALGDFYDAQYKLENADVILSLDADFLSSNAFPGFLPMSAAYAERHRYETGKVMNRLYVVESMPTVTGGKAEHRLGLKPSDIEKFAAALVSGSGFNGSEWAEKFFKEVVADLKKAGSKAVVVAGEQSSPAVQAAAHALNAQLGAVGSTVVYTETVQALPSVGGQDLKALVSAMRAGQVRVLVMLGANPAYNAPADLRFGDAMTKVPFVAHHGLYLDETAQRAHWHVNAAHYLESWSDARSYDGTISVIQPMIDPLYGGKTAHDMLQAALDNAQMTSHEVVQANFKTYAKGGDAAAWQKALHDGWVEGTAFEPKSGVSGKGGSIAPTMSAALAGTYEIAFKADPSIYDGRFANNGWLQELPKQVTRMAWDNAAIMGIDTMAALKIEERDLIELEINGQKVVFPPFALPGHPEGVITVHLGGGRWFGRVGQYVGSDANKLRSIDAQWAQSGVKVKPAEGKYDLCVTQVHDLDHRGKFAQSDLAVKTDPNAAISEPGHEAMERGVIRTATLAEAQKNPGFAHEGNLLYETPKKDDSFFPEAWKYDNVDKSTGQIQNAWGMSIDLNSCIGCNACVVSCYAENNIPVVGREQVKVGRKMDWIRIDTYFEGDLHAPKAHFQPMLCQHCENAGCEQVCPVGATVHTPEGLNQMVYNRCVGTRYCSNNCPYKVRRFNFLLYSDYDTESLKFMRNPDVSVRSRGVMEKCTYCTQRIQAVKIEADKEGRAIRDGEIVTACQQACPTDAIVFGNINDKGSRVARRKAEERNYQVLADLNYRPRTSYTAGVSNPNPELEMA